MLGCLMALCGLAAVASAESDGPPPPELRAVPDFHVAVADTDTRVLIARVNLKIGNLVLSPGEKPALTGTYEIRVPLRSSKDEVGGMVLPLDQSIEHYLREGGVLTGKGQSFNPPHNQRQIVCKIHPASEGERSGVLHLSVDTGNRVMEFETTYRVVGEIPGPDAYARLVIGEMAIGVL